MGNDPTRLVPSIVLFSLLFFLGYTLTLSFSFPKSNPHPRPFKYAGLGFDNDNINISSSAKASAPWCTPEECASGRWEPRKPAFTSLEQFRAAYANRLDHVWKGCRAPIFPGDERSQGKVDEERLMDVMGWTWTPYVGGLRKWDADEFMIRLLRSPGGLILIGDSISQQHHHALGYLLNQGDLNFDRRLPFLPMYNHRNVHQALLKPHDPKTRELLQRAGVPESRLKRPVVTMLEDHMLIDEPEIRAITEKMGASKSYYWYHNFQRVPDWEQFVANASRPREGEEDTVTEDTVMLMNAGAHWSRHELAMLPARNSDKEEQARVKESYIQMINIITRRLSPIPRLSVYYRSTAPAHPSCENHSKPYNNSIVAREAETHIVPRLKAAVSTAMLERQRSRWDWDLFAVHNELWRTKVRRLMRERRGPGARWFYLDLWDVNLQRPDAHSEPGIDCLHWCLPSVLNEWTAHLNHNLFLDGLARGKDGKDVEGM
ncbi:hypothetical protein Hypma_004567 [Hypsizygus marmoreus]|uniref:Uncharacterized protein n=1 Tax=Hypsizygus marmoreus TaxID=39966 RepID=A0A369JXU5_HYPMA|nr:hypothetical protein Hypma_004567 [Hypsizygus marmoreus]